MEGSIAIIIIFIAGVILGALIIWLFLRSKADATNATATALLENNLENSKLQLEDKQQEILILKEKESHLFAEFENIKVELVESEKQKSVLEEKSKQIPALSEKLEKLEGDLTKKADELKEEASKRATAEEKTKQIAELKQSLEKKETEFKDASSEITTLKANLRGVTAQTEEEKKALEEKIELLQEAEKNLKTVFENTANKIFENKQKHFKEESKESLTNTIDPLKKEFEEFKKKVEEINRFDTKERQSITEQIKNMTESSLKMTKEAQNLTVALKGDKKTQGNWGEVQLERVLEESGLQKGREYTLQKSLVDEDGKKRIPDAIVHLPEKKDLIIDSKVSLVDYEQYCSEEDEEQKNSALKRHIEAIKNHISGLNLKAYEKLEGVNTLDFVFIFIPIEPAYLIVVQHDPGVFQKAFEKNVVVVSPTTLIPTLRIVYNIWQNDRQNKNTEAIAKHAGDMYDKFVGFLDSMENIGKHLDKTSSVYQTAFSRLKDGKGNLISRAEKIKQLGAKARKSVPEKLLDQAENLDEPAEIEL